MVSYGICLSLTGLFHLAKCSPDPSMQRAKHRDGKWLLPPPTWMAFFPPESRRTSEPLLMWRSWGQPPPINCHCSMKYSLFVTLDFCILDTDFLKNSFLLFLARQVICGHHSQHSLTHCTNMREKKAGIFFREFLQNKVLRIVKYCEPNWEVVVVSLH